MKCAVALLMILALGCGPEDASSPLAGTGEIHAGKGLTGHTPLNDGDDLEVWLGPQGGHMVYVCFRARGFEPGDPQDPNHAGNLKATFTAMAGDEVLGVVNRKIGLSAVEDGLYAAPGTILVIESPDGDEFPDLPLTIRIRLVDAAGTVGETTVDVLAFYAGEDDVEPGG